MSAKLEPAYLRNDDGPALAPYLDPPSSRYLDQLGRNRPQVGFALVAGKQNRPGWFFYGDEQTGAFSDGLGRVAFTLFGRKQYVLAPEGIEFLDRDGRLWGLGAPNDFLALAVGDIKAGQAVFVPEGVLERETVSLALLDSPSPAVGLAVVDALDGEIVQVRTEGILQLPTWMELVAAITLEDSEYYLGVSGEYSTTAGSQLLCSRLGPKTVRVRCTAGGTGGGGDPICSEMNWMTKTVGATAVKLLDANPSRDKFSVENTGEKDIYMGYSEDVVAGNVEDPNGGGLITAYGGNYTSKSRYTGEVWAITLAGESVVFAEESIVG